MGIVGHCTVFNNGLRSIIALEEFGSGGHWRCRGCSESSSGGLLTGPELGVDYSEEECSVRGLLKLGLG